MKKAITKRQKELLLIIYQYIKDTGYPPTFAEMKDRLGVASNQSVVDLLAKLGKQRILKKNESIARGIAILPMGYNMLGKPPLAAFLGTTSAGVPMETIEISGEWESVGSCAAKLKDEVYLLKISGDSMVNASIEDGDIVLVQKQKEFVSGDIVLAQIGSESTVKRFISQDKAPYVYLKPENPNYTNILFKDDTRLDGKVISILKDGYWKSIK